LVFRPQKQKTTPRQKPVKMDIKPNIDIMQIMIMIIDSYGFPTVTAKETHFQLLHEINDLPVQAQIHSRKLESPFLTHNPLFLSRSFQDYTVPGR
jgi:hypothetical protein